MKKFFLFFVMWACLCGAGFAGPSYDMATGVLTLPTLEINGQIAFTNVSLLFKADGTCSVLAFNVPVVPIPTADKIFPYRDTIQMQQPISVGDVFFLSDGSAWTVKGTPWYFASRSFVTLDIVIYNKGSESLSPPKEGTKAEYWMLIRNGLTPHFIEPL